MKTQKAALLACALLASPISLAQEAADSDQNKIQAEMCAKTKCQHNVRVTLKDESGGTFDRTFETFTPVVQPFGFMIAAGQTIYVEADLVNGKLENLVAVDSVRDPAKTISAKLEQVDGKGMMLSVTNPFKEALKFNMGIMPLGKDDLYKTSSCPVVAGGGSFEMWPYPLFQVALGNGRALKEGETMACVE